MRKIFENGKKNGFTIDAAGVSEEIRTFRAPFENSLVQQVVNNDFKTLIDFLGRCGSEVSGHKIAQPDTEAAAMLDRFARGECEGKERREVCEMLRLHPAWLRWLADRVRLARRPPETNS